MLLVVSGGARGKKLKLGDQLTVGKAPDNDLVLPDDTVSRHHCVLERRPEGIVVRDLGSTNQTRVGRTAVREATIEPGSTISVGNVELVLRSEPNRAQILPSESPQFGEVIGASLAMRSIFGLLERIAPTDACVLIEGETGTGKDVLARSIHQQSARKDSEFVVVDCGAISYNLIESELFGHERGAYTGAVAARQGAFELAGRGTVFLDEVGELPLDVQPKLLRVLESGEFRRVGGNKTMRTEARIIAATKRNLREEVERGKFREDLYFRLSVVPVTVPPLRQRREDIPALVERFLDQARKRVPAAANVTLVPHSYYYGPGLAATLHAVACTPGVPYVEYGAGELAPALMQAPIRCVDGRLAVDDRPGLGADPDPEVIARFPYAREAARPFYLT